ncbi:unnamed protein product [Rotaria sp. Silwood1]|nr:unnamed protein product [Rotaria sp. Silwood1]
MYGECISCQPKVPSNEIPKLYPQLDLDEEANEIQNEIMSKHWSTSQSSLFTIQVKTKDNTSHGKGAVDGLGAVVKSAARRETMRAGIRSYHHFEPVDSTTIRCKTTSNAVLYKDSSISRQNESQLKYVKRVLTIEDVKLNNYIVVEYQDSWWLAVVKDIEVNLQELHVTFLHPPGPRTSFQFPTKSDELKIELGNVICLLHEAPRLSARNTCSITQELFEEIQQIFSEN